MDNACMTTERSVLRPGLEQLTLTAIGTTDEIRRLRHAAVTELCQHATCCPTPAALQEAVRYRFNQPQKG